jgi:hypothetical protein
LIDLHSGAIVGAEVNKDVSIVMSSSKENGPSLSIKKGFSLDRVDCILKGLSRRAFSLLSEKSVSQCTLE